MEKALFPAWESCCWLCPQVPGLMVARSNPQPQEASGPPGGSGQLLTAHQLRLESRSLNASFLFGDVIWPWGSQPHLGVGSLDDQWSDQTHLSSMLAAWSGTCTSTLGPREERGVGCSMAFSELLQEALLSWCCWGVTTGSAEDWNTSHSYLPVTCDTSFLLSECSEQLRPPCLGRTGVILSCEAGENFAFHFLLLSPPSFRILLEIFLLTIKSCSTQTGKITSLKLMASTVLRNADTCLAWLKTNSGRPCRRFPSCRKVGWGELEVIWK